MVIFVSGLKAYVFYLVIKLFMKLNLAKPCDEGVRYYITQISWFVFFTGMSSYIAHRFTKHLVQKGYEVDAVSHFWSGTEAFLLMAAVLFVIAQIFKKGIELLKNDPSEKTGSIIPIAFPIIAGSGTLTTIISMRAVYTLPNIVMGLIINLVFVYIVLRSSSWIEKKLGDSGLSLIRKFFGIVLLSIAIRIFKTNF
jgi:hypothetical protein